MRCAAAHQCDFILSAVFPLSCASSSLVAHTRVRTCKSRKEVESKEVNRIELCSPNVAARLKQAGVWELYNHC